MVSGQCRMVGVHAGGRALLLTFCGCGDGLGVGHGERDGSHSAVMWGGCQDWGEVARDLSYHLTAAVGLELEYRQPYNTVSANTGVGEPNRGAH